MTKPRKHSTLNATKFIVFLNKTSTELKFEKSRQPSTIEPKKKGRNNPKLDIQVSNMSQIAWKSWSPKKEPLWRRKYLDDWLFKEWLDICKSVYGKCVYEKSEWWVTIFAKAISIKDFKGFIADYRWNQQVKLTNFYQFCIFFFGEGDGLSTLWFHEGHKQFFQNKNIPHTSRLWDTCENNVLLAKGISKFKISLDSLPETPQDIVKKYSYSSDQKDCMFNDCTEW